MLLYGRCTNIVYTIEGKLNDTSAQDASEDAEEVPQTAQPRHVEDHFDVLVTYALVLFVISWTIVSNHNETPLYVPLALSSGISFSVVEGVMQEVLLIQKYFAYLRFERQKTWP
jgi:hypothetical protein